MDPSVDLNTLPRRDGDQYRVLDVQRIAEFHRVVIDTGSLTIGHAEAVLCGQLLPALKRFDSAALISVRTIDALNASAKSAASHVADRAKQAISILTRFQECNALIDAADPHVIAGDVFETEALLTELFVGYQQRESLCLITQNESLAWAVLRNARSGAFEKAKPVVAAYVAHDGLRNWAPELLHRVVVPTSAQEVTGDEMEVAIRDCKVFVDTCSWMLADRNKDDSTRGAKFLTEQVLPQLRASNNPIMLPERVKLELEKLATGAPPASFHAAAGLAAVNEFTSAGMAVVASDPNEVAGSDRFADPLFVRLAVRFQSEFDLCFVTQDTNLAKLLVASRKPGTGHKFLVMFIPMKGKQLQPWSKKLDKPAAQDQQHQPAQAQGKRSAGNASQGRHSEAELPQTPPIRRQERSVTHIRRQAQPRVEPSARSKSFDIKVELTRPDPTPLAVSHMPDEGDTVIGSKSGPLLLVEKLAAGGEGSVYRTSKEEVVCKVYHQDCLTIGRQEKLQLMLSRDVQIDGVCWPTELVTNTDGQFVGFLMPKVSGKMLRTSVFAKVLLAKHFPDWTRIELTELAITMLKTIRELHYIGVLVGDVNPQNILVRDERHIAIVDADSFQVEGYACPVGTDTFTPPNRQGSNFGEFLRSHDDELFAVATLLFETLFPGKAPYSSQGGGDVKENMRAMRFAYGKEADGKPPVGAWQFIWSHLHPKLKDDFTEVFARGERVGINQFIKHLEWSLREMREGTRDKSLFPDKPWQKEGQTVSMQCATCPPEKATHEVSVYLAEKLKADGKGFTCNTCASMKKMSRLQSTREVDCEVKISPDCKVRYVTNAEKIEQLRLGGKRLSCPNCFAMQRQQWEAEKASRPVRHRNNGYRQASSRHPSQSTSAPCFIATAVYQDAMAPEVVTLRHFRDTVLKRYVLGRTFVRAYYSVGPWAALVVNKAPVLRTPFRKTLDWMVSKLAKP